MPKPRASSSRQLEFQVAPWQIKEKGFAAAQEDEEHEIQFQDLIKVPVPSPASHAVAAAPRSQEPGGLGSSKQGTATPWISTAPGRATGAAAAAPSGAIQRPSGTGAMDEAAAQPAAEAPRAPASHPEPAESSPASAAAAAAMHQDAVPSALRQPKDGNGDDGGGGDGDGSGGGGRQVDVNEEEEEDDAFDLTKSGAGTGAAPRASPGALDGLCHLALLPSGHMSGHVVERRTLRMYGVMARCVSGPPGSRAGCMEDADTDVLKLRLLNFKTNEEAEAVVCKTGGDMARLRPAEAWQLRKHLGIHDADKAEEVLELQVSFTAEQLLEGGEADQHLTKFNPKLRGRDAVVNTGPMQVRGLPPGFL